MPQNILSLKGRLCRKNCRNEGFATIWFLIAVVAITALMAVVMTFSFQSIQMNKAKHALNHAVKAAAMQMDMDAFVYDAKLVIDPVEARMAFDEILGGHKGLEGVEVVEFVVLDESDYVFPYTISRPDIRFSHTFEAPGVMAVIRIELLSFWGAREREMYVPAVAEMAIQAGF
ncbi:hypothetical protein GCM10010965_27670 [Caldalkalibacillus thermarum]|uniref:hypothetical protein n=1 Tax=Caldalkalibacillus thermarum TaxID=296745 RepID=UPI00166738EF|nr:hypothetical protein [Caldalkalibacillus thermarum]GGK33290.1 hypothetical protein GCM10010965_27670 [Caldalkalibacillus thermarum]